MSGPQRTVLVIDDEAHITHVVSLKLRNAGYEVVTAADGEEGFEAALQHAPSLVITDLQMPYLDGLELSKKLKKTRETADTPVLMLTARGFGLTDGDIEDTNIVGMLSKPFSPREMLNTIQEILGDATDSGPSDAKAA